MQETKHESNVVRRAVYVVLVGLLFGIIGGLGGRAGGFDPVLVTAAVGFGAGIVAALVVIAKRS